MSNFHDVALVGFAPSEYATFETFFRLVSSRRARPFRATGQIAGAKLIMLSTAEVADIERTLTAIRPEQRLVTIGMRRVQQAWRHLDRPINLNAVLVTVDTALSEDPELRAAAPSLKSANSTAQGANDAAKPAGSVPQLRTAIPTRAPSPSIVSPIAASIDKPRVPSTSTAPIVAPPVAPRTVVQPAAASNSGGRPTPQRTDNVTPFPSASSSAVTRSQTYAEPPKRVETEAPSVPAVGASIVRILVVDDSDVALKFIHARLSAFGFQVDKCSSGEEALVRVADGDYQFVFLDVMMEGLDGYQTCKAIKGKRYAAGRAPVVVMLTSRTGTFDKMRGTFAGCDAYLTKPLDETKMLKVLLKHDADIGHAISTMTVPTMAGVPTANKPSDGSNVLAAAYSQLRDRVQ
jgi:CheY-like chemotaxis protein